MEHHANYYSPEGQLLPFGEKGLEPDPNHIEIVPENLNEMISIVESYLKDLNSCEWICITLKAKYILVNSLSILLLVCCLLFLKNGIRNWVVC